MSNLPFLTIRNAQYGPIDPLSLMSLTNAQLRNVLSNLCHVYLVLTFFCVFRILMPPTFSRMALYSFWYCQFCNKGKQRLFLGRKLSLFKLFLRCGIVVLEILILTSTLMPHGGLNTDPVVQGQAYGG